MRGNGGREKDLISLQTVGHICFYFLPLLDGNGGGEGGKGGKILKIIFLIYQNCPVFFIKINTQHLILLNEQV